MGFFGDLFKVVSGTIGGIVTGGVGAAIGAIGAGIGEIFDGDSGAKSAIRRSANASVAAFEKAQKLINKTRDERITSLEADSLLRRGLITAGERASIDLINKSVGLAIDPLDHFVKLTEGDAEALEFTLLEDIGRSGIFQRNELEEGVLAAIGQKSSLTERALSVLSPATDIGKQAIRKLSLVSGFIPRDQQTLEDREFLSLGSDQFQLEQKALNERLDFLQRAEGTVFSGIGLEAFPQLAADLKQKEFDRLTKIVDIGQQATIAGAGILEKTGTVVAELQRELAVNRQKQRQTELELGITAKEQAVTTKRKARGAAAQLESGIQQIAGQLTGAGALAAGIEKADVVGEGTVLEQQARQRAEQLAAELTLGTGRVRAEEIIDLEARQRVEDARRSELITKTLVPGLTKLFLGEATTVEEKKKEKDKQKLVLGN